MTVNKTIGMAAVLAAGLSGAASAEVIRYEVGTQYTSSTTGELLRGRQHFLEIDTDLAPIELSGAWLNFTSGGSFFEDLEVRNSTGTFFYQPSGDPGGPYGYLDTFALEFDWINSISSARGFSSRFWLRLGSNYEVEGFGWDSFDGNLFESASGSGCSTEVFSTLEVFESCSGTYASVTRSGTTSSTNPTTVSPVPLPASSFLLAFGLAMIAGFRRFS